MNQTGFHDINVTGEHNSATFEVDAQWTVLDRTLWHQFRGGVLGNDSHTSFRRVDSDSINLTTSDGKFDITLSSEEFLWDSRKLDDVKLDYNHYPIGDSTLDGKFDSSDLVYSFQQGFYNEVVPYQFLEGFRQGDWNHDSRFDSSDLVAAFQYSIYSNDSIPQGAIIVPEPNYSRGRNIIIISVAVFIICLFVTRKDAYKIKPEEAKKLYEEIYNKEGTKENSTS